IQAAIRISGSDLLVDYAGSSPQVEKGINSVYNYTFAYTAFPLKCILDPLTPNNEGAFRAVRVDAPLGSVLNPRPPAPVSARQLVRRLIQGAVVGALAPVLPERVQADSGAPVWSAVFSGERPRTQDPFCSIVFLNGGVGARSEHDGISALAFPTNVSATPIEVHEHLAPMLFECKELGVDAGGAGRRRGGLGQRVRIRSLAERPVTVSMLTDRIEHAPEGTLGGAPGLCGALLHSRLPWVDPKGQHVLLPGDV